jgi:hypothetical protein
MTLLFTRLVTAGTPTSAQAASCNNSMTKNDALAIHKNDVEALGDTTCDLKIDLLHSSLAYQDKL